MKRRYWIGLVLLVLLVVPGVPHHYPIPPVVDVAQGQACHTRTIYWKHENSHTGIDQYKGQTHVFSCVTDDRTKVKPYKRDQRDHLHRPRLGRQGWFRNRLLDAVGHPTRPVEIRQKDLKFCPGSARSTPA